MPRRLETHYKTLIWMHTHTAGHVDRHGENVAVRPCTQTDKVAIAAGFRPINFPPHSFMACIFFFFGGVLSRGSRSWIHIFWPWLAQPGLHPQCIGFSHEKLVFWWNVPPFSGLTKLYNGLARSDLIHLGPDNDWYTIEQAGKWRDWRSRTEEMCSKSSDWARINRI